MTNATVPIAQAPFGIDRHMGMRVGLKHKRSDMHLRVHMLAIVSEQHLG